jgi:death-on-curing protein
MPGLRDEGLLESALAKPQQAEAYAGADLVQAACSLCLGIVKNHAFADGNKRTGLMATKVMFGVNGWDFSPPWEEEVEVMVQVAEGTMPAEVLEQWMRDHACPDPALQKLADLDSGIAERQAVPTLMERLHRYRENKEMAMGHKAQGTDYETSRQALEDLGDAGALPGFLDMPGRLGAAKTHAASEASAEAHDAGNGEAEAPRRAQDSFTP